MRYFMTATMLAAMAAAAIAQDPYRNRMNDQFPEVVRQERVAAPSAATGFPSPFANRMNVRYEESSSTELTGGPNPYGNRMNVQWATTPRNAKPKDTDRAPIEPSR